MAPSCDHLAGILRECHRPRRIIHEPHGDVMKLRLDLVLSAILVASAGSELVAPDALYAAEPARQACQTADATGKSRNDAEHRIRAEGYTEVRIIARGCDKVWHALALAEGDPVNVQVTPDGAVLTE
jgi:hypothetical protein